MDHALDGIDPVFGRLGIPNVLIDLALMIYHFLFVTATTVKEMRGRNPGGLAAPVIVAACALSPCSPVGFSPKIILLDEPPPGSISEASAHCSLCSKNCTPKAGRW